MMKKLVVVLLFLATMSFAYLPVSISSQTYLSNAYFYAITATTSIDNLTGVNLSCVHPFLVNISLVSSESTPLNWSGSILINESGSWNCSAIAYNATDVEVNSTVFSVVCPSLLPIDYLGSCLAHISISVDTNLTYYDIGDNVTLWSDITNTSNTRSMYIYSSDNTTTTMIYSIIREKWYAYYQVRQSQEILIIQSFNDSGVVTGIGEFVLTKNPINVTASSWESMWLNLVNYAIMGAIFFVIIVVVIVLGPMLMGMIFESYKSK
jgi:hypothetical protein